MKDSNINKVEDKLNESVENMEEMTKAKKCDKKEDKKCKKLELENEKLTLELKKVKRESLEKDERVLRNQAELMNFKRRKEEETTRLLKYAEEDVVLGFLPILDNFERAIKMDDNNLEDEVSKFLDGFKMVYTQIKSLLEKFEVKEIESLHKEFDPTYHQAVLTDKDENFDSGIIIEVLQKGYMYKDKVIRPTMVKVNE